MKPFSKFIVTGWPTNNKITGIRFNDSMMVKVLHKQTDGHYSLENKLVIDKAPQRQPARFRMAQANRICDVLNTIYESSSGKPIRNINKLVAECL